MDDLLFVLYMFFLRIVFFGNSLTINILKTNSNK